METIEVRNRKHGLKALITVTGVGRCALITITATGRIQVNQDEVTVVDDHGVTAAVIRPGDECYMGKGAGK